MIEVEDVAVTAEDLAKEIEKLSRVFKALDDSRLQRRTVVLLLRDMTKVGKRNIEEILDALPKLADRYLKAEE
jgi:hypothetical protein